MNRINHFGEEVKELRIKRELSMRTLSKRINIDSGTLSKIEKGKRPPPENISFVRKIKKELNLNEYEYYNLMCCANESFIPTTYVDELQHASEEYKFLINR